MLLGIYIDPVCGKLTMSLKVKLNWSLGEGKDRLVNIGLLVVCFIQHFFAVT